MDKLEKPYVWGASIIKRRGKCENSDCGSRFLDSVDIWDGENPESCYHRNGKGYQRRGFHCLNCNHITQMREYKSRSK